MLYANVNQREYTTRVAIIINLAEKISHHSVLLLNFMFMCFIVGSYVRFNIFRGSSPISINLRSTALAASLSLSKQQFQFSFGTRTLYAIIGGLSLSPNLALI